MTYKQLLTLLGLFIGGYALTAAASQDPSSITWDWVAVTTGLTAAGISQMLKTDDVPRMMQILSTIGAFMVGWAGAEVAVGYRYVIWHFDFRALAGGLGMIGLLHSQNPSVASYLTGQGKP
jgi:hypothetical protein